MADMPQKSILVVDDEPDTCQNLADILSDRGFHVETAPDGETALRLIHERTFDVAILDLRMPGMDGLALYRQMRRERSDIVAIIVTAYVTETTAREAIDSGASQVLSKPVDLEKLISIVDSAAQQPVVMIVDDDHDLCDNLWEVLRDRHIRVAIAHSEKEALECIARQRCHVALIDLKLPGGDGRNIIREIQEHRPDVQAVLITAFPDEFEESLAAARAGSSAAVFCKPFDLSSLLAAIDKLAGRASSGD